MRQVANGLSRRALLRRSLGAAILLVLVEGASSMVSALWPVSSRAPKRIRVGTVDDLVARSQGIPFGDGFPLYVDAAQAFVVLVDPNQGFQTGADETGTGAGVNVIALSKICPHLGCRPNPCLEDWWMRCPCHQSRYDRLGIKAAGEGFGPAPRGMDRFAVEVDQEGVLTIDMGKVILGPQPIPLGQPGLIPPRVPHGCT